jgi:Flp pilus assembly protein TadG
MKGRQAGAETAASRQVDARSGARKGHGFTGREKGQAAVEFAIVAPILLTLLIAISVFGIAFNNYLALTFATNTAAQTLAISRGQTTDPCQTTSQAVYSAAPQLTQSNLKFSISLGTNSVASSAANPTCSGSQQYLVQSQNAKVTVTYPCNLNIMGYNPVPNCALTAQTTMLIQ